jgi:hypothetical protein
VRRSGGVVIISPQGFSVGSNHRASLSGKSAHESVRNVRIVRHLDECTASRPQFVHHRGIDKLWKCAGLSGFFEVLDGPAVGRALRNPGEYHGNIQPHDEVRHCLHVKSLPFARELCRLSARIRPDVAQQFEAIHFFCLSGASDGHARAGIFPAADAAPGQNLDDDGRPPVRRRNDVVRQERLRTRASAGRVQARALQRRAGPLCRRNLLVTVEELRRAEESDVYSLADGRVFRLRPAPDAPTLAQIIEMVVGDLEIVTLILGLVAVRQREKKCSQATALSCSSSNSNSLSIGFMAMGIREVEVAGGARELEQRFEIGNHHRVRRGDVCLRFAFAVGHLRTSGLPTATWRIRLHASSA